MITLPFANSFGELILSASSKWIMLWRGRTVLKPDCVQFRYE